MQERRWTTARVQLKPLRRRARIGAGYESWKPSVLTFLACHLSYTKRESADHGNVCRSPPHNMPPSIRPSVHRRCGGSVRLLVADWNSRAWVRPWRVDLIREF